jgi:hypothetical protein
MKVSTMGMVGLLILASSLSAQKIPNISIRNNDIFTGQITDSLCADGHHIDVVKSEKNCVLACVKFDGAEFVLYNPGTKQTYQLDDQKQPVAFAGQEVIVTGRYDKITKTIHVIAIRPRITDAGL